jgi:hypothetical protein
MKPNAWKYIMRWGAFWGFIAAMIYSMFPMGAPYYSPSMAVALIYPPVWIVALFIGALPGGIIGALMGLIYDTILMQNRFPMSIQRYALLSFACTLLGGIAVALIDYILLLGLFGNSSIRFFGQYSMDYAPYLLPVPYIAGLTAAFVSYRYFTHLWNWLAENDGFEKEKKKHHA